MKTKPQKMISVPEELLRLLLPDEQISALVTFAQSLAMPAGIQPQAKAAAKKPHGNAGRKVAHRKSPKEWIDLLATRKVSETAVAFAKRVGTSEQYLYQLLKKYPEVRRMPAWNDK